MTIFSELNKIIVELDQAPMLRGTELAQFGSELNNLICVAKKNCVSSIWNHSFHYKGMSRLQLGPQSDVNILSILLIKIMDAKTSTL